MFRGCASLIYEALCEGNSSVNARGLCVNGSALRELLPVLELLRTFNAFECLLGRLFVSSLAVVDVRAHEADFRL